ncbi:NAD(P)-dependent alcohol dehydrogenase [Pedobacter aquatilis]|uniref:NAD(P)-dependent alcohol dehydrogenase n=1 Tax=Pedobacter aquatilis TaxID=351343 RepID=UPI0029311572|nr:NAD(P)-dependent alcohol dehydrogenase [Pedobacter aquatilis]
MKNSHSRRAFIQQTAIIGAGVAAAGPLSLLANDAVPEQILAANVKSKGYAGRDKNGELKQWNFERRPVGDNDILIDIKYSGICHSDIHTIKGHWGLQKYPQVPGHEIAGIVAAVGKKVIKFKVGDKAGVGCMVNSCMSCDSCKKGEEHHCETTGMTGTYGATEASSPTGITQGGYSTNIVVTEHFAIKIPESIELKYAAPLLCAGITTYSPLMRANFKKGNKIGVAGIGGLGHIAIKLAVAKGAEVYAFTTSASKVEDIKGFGAKEIVVVDSPDKLKAYYGKLDYMISTIPYDFDVAAYAMVLKPYKEFTQVGMPVEGKLTINNFMMIRNRVNFNGSLIGGIPETQEVMDYCASNKIYPQVEVIKGDQINQAWDKVVNKAARYRYVIDASTI